MVEAIHTAVAGRARFKVEGLYRSKSLEKQLEWRLARLKDISLASANALTGNVLVCYNSGNTPQTIATLIEGIVSECQGDPQPGLPVPVLHKFPDAAGQEVQPGVLDRFKGLFAYPEAYRAEPWHILSAEAVLARWQTSRETGLSLQAVQRNRQKYGANLLPEAEPRSGWEIFFEQFNSLPVALLGAAAGLSVVTGGMVDAVLIAGVVVANAFIGYKTESESEKTIRSLQTLVRPAALVNREGRLTEIPSEEVAFGDLLVLRPGTYVAADARLVEANHLSVDESALTGESLPVTKDTRVLERDNIPLGDRVNMVFMGTLVTGGEGLAVVVATGSFTEIGLIQSLIGAATSPGDPPGTAARPVGRSTGPGLLRYFRRGLCHGLHVGLRLAGDAAHLHLPGRGRGAGRAARRGHHHPGPGHPGHAPPPCPDPPPERGGNPGGRPDRLPG